MSREQHSAPFGFWQRPGFKKGFAVGMVALALALALTGWLVHVAVWLVAAAGVLAVLAVVEAAITAQAAIHAHRERVAQAWEAIGKHIEAYLPLLKADYWRGNHYGRQGLESSWRWRNALASRAAQLYNDLPEADRVASMEEVRQMMALRTEEAVTADPYWVFYDPRMARADFVHYCQLMLEEYGWTVVAPRPGCFETVDLAADNDGTTELIRAGLISQPPSRRTMDAFAGEVAASGLQHAVIVVDGALHHELRYRADDLGVATYRHDDLAVLGVEAGRLPRVKPPAVPG
ncbi:MAG: hypothetical protein ABEK42_06580 [Thiohalorhabdaceae bacterium]